MTTATAADLFTAGASCHVRYHSDIKPCTVISRTARTLTVQFDHAELDPTWKPVMHPGGFAAHCSNNHEQRWIITRDTEGRTAKFTLRKNGAWIAAGDEIRGGRRLGAGWKNFHDYNF